MPGKEMLLFVCGHRTSNMPGANSNITTSKGYTAPDDLNMQAEVRRYLRPRKSHSGASGSKVMADIERGDQGPERRRSGGSAPKGGTRAAASISSEIDQNSESRSHMSSQKELTYPEPCQVLASEVYRIHRLVKKRNAYQKLALESRDAGVWLKLVKAERDLLREINIDQLIILKTMKLIVGSALEVFNLENRRLPSLEVASIGRAAHRLDHSIYTIYEIWSMIADDPDCSELWMILIDVFLRDNLEDAQMSVHTSLDNLDLSLNVGFSRLFEELRIFEFYDKNVKLFPELQRIYVLIIHKLSMYLVQTGDAEYGRSLILACLELALYTPKNLRNAPHRILSYEFTLFWNSEAARLGDDCAKGWENTPDSAGVSCQNAQLVADREGYHSCRHANTFDVDEENTECVNDSSEITNCRKCCRQCCLAEVIVYDYISPFLRRVSLIYAQRELLWATMDVLGCIGLYWHRSRCVFDFGLDLDVSEKSRHHALNVLDMVVPNFEFVSPLFCKWCLRFISTNSNTDHLKTFVSALLVQPYWKENPEILMECVRWLYSVGLSDLADSVFESAIGKSSCISTHTLVEQYRYSTFLYAGKPLLLTNHGRIIGQPSIVSEGLRKLIYSVHGNEANNTYNDCLRIEDALLIAEIIEKYMRDTDASISLCAVKEWFLYYLNANPWFYELKSIYVKIITNCRQCAINVEILRSRGLYTICGLKESLLNPLTVKLHKNTYQSIRIYVTKALTMSSPENRVVLTDHP